MWKAGAGIPREEYSVSQWLAVSLLNHGGSFCKVEHLVPAQGNPCCLHRVVDTFIHLFERPPPFSNMSVQVGMLGLILLNRAAQQPVLSSVELLTHAVVSQAYGAWSERSLLGSPLSFFQLTGGASPFWKPYPQSPSAALWAAHCWQGWKVQGSSWQAMCILV